MNLPGLWPLYIAIIAREPALLPLALSIGMGLHCPVVGWIHVSRACLFHARARVVLVTAVWVWLPAERLTLQRLTAAFLYLTSVV